MKILVVSDIHANIDGLNAVLDAAASSCGALVCLGDITGYGPDPEECVQTVRGLKSAFDPCVVLSGNHDAALSGKIPLEWFNRNARSSVEDARRHLSTESFEWLASLPASTPLRVPTVKNSAGFFSAFAAHGSPIEPLTGYLWGTDETTRALAWLAKRGFDLCFCGHTHEAAVFSRMRDARVRYPVPGTVVPLGKRTSADGPLIMNPGSTGFPRSFNGGRTADMQGEGEAIGEPSFPAYYAVWDTEGENVTFRDARYDRRPMEDRLSRI